MVPTSPLTRARVGRQALRRHLPRLRKENEIAFCIVNAENAAGGAGITRETARELYDAGADCLTTGNHVWDKKEVIPYLEEDPRLLRPANYPAPCPGSGVYVGTAENGARVAVINLMGRVYMNQLDSPFVLADGLLDGVGEPLPPLRFVDFHCEITSEKNAMGWYLDGRVTAVVGTHTHVPTADAKVLPQGTAYLSDVGMTGPRDSVIGFRLDTVLPRFLRHLPTRFEVADGPVSLNAALIEADRSTGRALSIVLVQRLVEV